MLCGTPSSKEMVRNGLDYIFVLQISLLPSQNCDWNEKGVAAWAAPCKEVPPARLLLAMEEFYCHQWITAWKTSLTTVPVDHV